MGGKAVVCMCKQTVRTQGWQQRPGAHTGVAKRTDCQGCSAPWLSLASSRAMGQEGWGLFLTGCNGLACDFQATNKSQCTEILCSQQFGGPSICCSHGTKSRTQGKDKSIHKVYPLFTPQNERLQKKLLTVDTSGMLGVRDRRWVIFHQMPYISYLFLHN